MPPKPKRSPAPTLSHLKHSKQVLEDFLYQYLPLLSGMGSISRLNLFSWSSSRWSLSPDAKQGLPFMILDALRLQRNHLLQQKLPLKPFSLSLLSTKEDSAFSKALLALQIVNNQSHTAKLSLHSLDWQGHIKQLQLQLQQQPAAERNFLLLDPLGLTLPSLQELLQSLPKKLDVLLLLPLQSLQLAGGYAFKQPLAEEIQQLAKRLPEVPQPEAEAPEVTTLQLIEQIRHQLGLSSNRFVMHLLYQDEATPLLLLGLTTDALMMEKMLQARSKLEALQAQQLQTGAQLGLFGVPAPSDATPDAGVDPPTVEQLIWQKQEWNNQDLYKALLTQEIPVQEGIKVVQALIAAGKLEVLDEKKKKYPTAANLALTNTAFKLPAPSRYFRHVK